MFKAYAIPKGTTPADALHEALADYQWRTGQPAPSVHVTPALAPALGEAEVEVIADPRVFNGLIYLPVGESAATDMPARGISRAVDASEAPKTRNGSLYTQVNASWGK